MTVPKALSKIIQIFKKIFFVIVINLGIIVLWIIIVAITSDNILIDIIASDIGTIVGSVGNIFSIINFLFPRIKKTIIITVIILTILF